MKLISRTTRNFALVVLIVLPIASGLLFLSLNYFLNDEVDEKLRVDELRITEQIKKTPDFISMAPIIEVGKTDIRKTIVGKIQNVFIYDPIEKEEEPFRELISVKEINGEWYIIKVRHSIIEDKDFALAIGLAMVLILLLVFALLLILNHRFSKKLWNPFYKNIERLKTFSFTGEEKLKLEDSTVNEFQDLKDSLEKLTNKLQKDYKSLKEFTENASHEIQTPLSIISLNLEEVLQDDHSEKNYKKLYQCYQSIQRLSKLNDRLLFLAKLDNNQYNDLADINLNQLFEEKLIEFGPLLNEKHIAIDYIQTGVFICRCDAILANMLVINLLSNIVKHATPNSTASIKITAHQLTLANNTNTSIDQEEIFERFKKGIQTKDSTGLGLSIVKRIIEVSYLSIQSSINQGVFTITIKKS